MTKLYAYTDESGRGALPFVVAVVIVQDDRDDLSDACEKIERETGKGFVKWAKAKYERRLAYMRTILTDERFAGSYVLFVLHRWMITMSQQFRRLHER